MLVNNFYNAMFSMTGTSTSVKHYSGSTGTVVSNSKIMDTFSDETSSFTNGMWNIRVNSNSNEVSADEYVINENTDITTSSGTKSIINNSLIYNAILSNNSSYTHSFTSVMITAHAGGNWCLMYREVLPSTVTLNPGQSCSVSIAIGSEQPALVSVN